jgi:ABC-type amino acid transport substrate-binding protein
MRRTNAFLVSCMATALLIAALAGPRPAAAQAGDLMQEIISRGTVKLCTAALAPWEFKDPNTGEWLGYNPELAQDFAKAANVKIEWVEAQWGTAIAALQAGKCDIGWAAFARTTQRALAVEFVEPHFYFGNFIAIKADNQKIKTYQDLNSPDVIFAARPDYSEVLLKQFFPKAQIKIIQSDNPDGPRLEVRANRADAVVDDGPTFAEFLRKKDNSWLKVLDLPPLTQNGAAWFLRPGNQRLLNFLNTFVEYEKEAGRIDELTKKWMSFK